MERIMIFIDGSNFYHGLKVNLGRANIDFQKFCDLLTGDRRLVHTHYYNVPVKQQVDPVKYADQLRFFGSLHSIPHFTLHLGRLVKGQEHYYCPNCKENFPGLTINCPNCGEKLPTFFYTEEGIDVSIATDMLSNAFNNAYDTAILVSGDGDFVPVVLEIKYLKKRVENAYFLHKGSLCYLSKTCDRFIELTKDFLKNLKNK